MNPADEDRTAAARRKVPAPDARVRHERGDATVISVIPARQHFHENGAKGWREPAWAIIEFADGSRTTANAELLEEIA